MNYLNYLVVNISDDPTIKEFLITMPSNHKQNKTVFTAQKIGVNTIKKTHSSIKNPKNQGTLKFISKLLQLSSNQLIIQL